MIDYQTYCQIKDSREREGLTVKQIAESMGLHRDTVSKWLAQPKYQRRQPPPRTSKLDPYKGDIVRWLDTHPLSAMQVLQRLRELGYDGGYSIVKDYVRTIRPRRPKAYLKLAFAPGESAQVDWGVYGSVPVGTTRRRLSFFVMVLCYSRMMYLEFTVSQTLEHFLGCHERAFQALGGGVKNVMVDNLKSAVLKRPPGEAPVFHPRYLDLANHFGFTIKPCGVGKGNEKGRVENGVGYVKKNLLNGLQIADFSGLNLTAQRWLDTVANVRTHGETRARPVDLLEKERPHLTALPEQPFDSAITQTLRASNQFRISYDGNRYSVPAEYASCKVQVKAYSDRLCCYAEGKLIARHTRCYDRHQDIEDPDHPRALLAQRRHAREQKHLARFLTLSPEAEAYYHKLTERKLNATHHVRKIVALADIYDADAVARALEDALAFDAVSSDYVANLLEQRARTPLDEPPPLHVPRAGDQLELTVEPPDLSIYDNDEGDGA